ncbi:receptor-type tyrosine-protein phosphatase F-like isoform X1 [Rhynchophorus ferrugineus]|uniref:receptor-type tyrosine-protein phosphatase F-like isoform X1 n=1 Tax=Rhynchophorus ferrugineus TaxID=354439 RepID=UPI003FCE6D1C
MIRYRFCHLCLWFLTIQYTSQTILTSIGNKCITNTSQAMSEIYNISGITKFAEGRSTVVPPIRSSITFQCSQQCTYWRSTNAIELNRVPNLVTDYRWEDFPGFVTINVDDKTKQMNYVKFLEINEINFSIPFSLRIKHEAHVFLCESESVWSSNCYWFLIDAWEGTYTALRQCKAYEIQRKYDGKAPLGTCGSSTYKILSPDTGYVNESKWTHMKITKSGKEYSLMKNNDTIFVLQPQYLYFQPRYMFINSKRVKGIWKLHNFTYWYSEYSSETVWDISFTNQTERSVCLSIFVVMCKYCWLKIIVQDKNSYSIFEETVDTKDELWKEHKFNVIFSGKIKREILFKTGESENNISPFWAFNNIRTCHMDEIRVFSAEYDEPNCILVGENFVINRNGVKASKLMSGVRCREDEFGEECLSCPTIFNGPCPRNHKYCQLNDYETGVKCYCTIGSIGGDCKINCSENKYGHGCSQNCSNCQDSCSNDPISGICNSQLCLDNYSGPKCDVPAGIYLFEGKLHTVPSYTTCLLSLNSIEGKGERPKYYRFQYKKRFEDQWTNTEEIPYTGYVSEKNLTDLEINSLYDVRIIGYSNITDLNDLMQMQQNIKLSECATKCKDIEPSDITIQPENNSAVFAATTKDKIGCPSHFYTFSVDGATISNGHIQNLKPYTSYNLKIQRKSNGFSLLLQFRTKESKPGAVSNIHYKLKENPTRVKLKWNSPTEPNGVITHYILSYKVSRFIACNRKETNANITYISHNSTSIELSNLIPYTLYSVEIVAYTSIGGGPPGYIDIQTKPADQISKEEITFKNLSVYKESVKFVYLSSDCHLIRGPFLAKLKLNGTNVWCLGNVTKTYNVTVGEMRTVEFSYSSLVPYCNYTYQLEIYRSNISVDIKKEGRFQTQPTAPLRPTEFDVFSKGKTYADLRWKPPYPPTGEIDYYELTIKYYWSTTDVFDANKCKLWPEYYCYRIKNLTSSYSYKFKLRVKNKAVDDYSEYITLDKYVKIEEEAPEAPYGGSVEWTEDNVMEISWHHPNRTNGPLTSFVIYVDNREYVHNVSEESYNITYQKQIRDIIISFNVELPKTYEIEIKSKNSAGESSPLILRDIESPPPIPIFSTKASNDNGSIQFQLHENLLQTASYNRFLYILMVKNEKYMENTLLTARDEISARHTTDTLELLSPTDSWKIVKSFNFNQPVKSDTIRFDQQDINQLITSSGAYNITLVWLFKYKQFIRTHIEYITAVEGGFSALTILYVFLALIIIAGVVTASWWYFRRRSKLNLNQNQQSNFISLPPIYINPENQLPPTGTDPIYEEPIEPQVVIPGHPLFKTEQSCLIKLEYFSSYVKGSVQSGELRRQYELLQNMKNGFNKPTACDVTTMEIAEEPHSDFINVKYLDGYNIPRAYIVTLGPQKKTIYDFWRMIWQENVSWIVIVANVIEGEKEEIEQYWPNAEDQLIVGDFVIAHQKSELHARYELRSFLVTKENGETKEIGQLHFKAWSDHGVPPYPQTLVPFFRKILTLRSPLLFTAVLESAVPVP